VYKRRHYGPRAHPTVARSPSRNPPSRPAVYIYAFSLSCAGSLAPVRGPLIDIIHRGMALLRAIRGIIRLCAISRPLLRDVNTPVVLYIKILLPGPRALALRHGRRRSPFHPPCPSPHGAALPSTLSHSSVYRRRGNPRDILIRNARLAHTFNSRKLVSRSRVQARAARTSTPQRN